MKIYKYFLIIIKNHRSSLKEYKCNFLSIRIKAKENGTFSYNKDYFNSYSEINMSYNDTKKVGDYDEIKKERD